MFDTGEMQYCHDGYEVTVYLQAELHEDNVGSGNGDEMIDEVEDKLVDETACDESVHESVYEDE